MTAGVTLKDKIKSRYIRGSLKISQTITAKMEEKRMRWYGHVKRREESHVVQEMVNKEIPRIVRRGRPKESWLWQMKRFQQHQGITDEEIQDRQAYRTRLRSHATTSNADR